MGVRVKKHRTKHTPKRIYQVVDIKKDIPEKHLAAIGAMALAFNEAEAALDRLFYVATELPEVLKLEVSTRIHGLDGKIPITKKAAAQFLEADAQEQLEELLGEGVFSLLKDYRDGVIHARHINPATGVGVKVDRQARVYDYLVQETTLNIAYSILVAIRQELDEAVTLVGAMQLLKGAAADDPKRGQFEAEVATYRVRFQQRRIARQALPPLPEFPSESELRAADLEANTNQTATILGWLSEWPISHLAPRPILMVRVHGDGDHQD
jgi:hypothetical protein